MVTENKLTSTRHDERSKTTKDAVWTHKTPHSKNGVAKRRELNRETAVLDYQPLVHRLCRRFSGFGEPPDDLLQVGTIGLIKAIAKFDAARGNSFITYAVPVIVGCLGDGDVAER